MLRPVNDEEVLRELDRMMQGQGNGARTAKVLGVDYNHLRQYKSGHRKISQVIADKLGFELRWVRTSESPIERVHDRMSDSKEKESFDWYVSVGGLIDQLSEKWNQRMTLSRKEPPKPREPR